GNKITQDGSEWLDTMGRHIPGFPSFQVPWPAPFVPGVMGATIDYSGCTGPLPISGAVVWNPPGIDGGTYPRQFSFASFPEINPGGVLMSLCDGCPGVQDGNPMVIPALPTIATQLQSVVLPNGQAWTFTYSGNAGNLSQIAFPTGGTISYTWGSIGTALVQADGLPSLTLIEPQAVVTRTVSSSDGTGPSGQWSYHYTRYPTQPTFDPNQTWQTVVTDPEQNDTVHTFSPLGSTGCRLGSTLPEFYETKSQSYEGPLSAGHLLKTVQT